MKCKTCRYYAEIKESDHMFITEGEGVCHRYPRPIPKYEDNWCGEHKRPTVKKKPENSGASKVIAYYCETFKDTFGANPTITGKDSGSAKRMLKTHTVAEINNHILEFFDATPMFYKDNDLYGLNHVESAWDKMVVKKAKIKIETADDYTYDDLLKEQTIRWGNHDLWTDYAGFVMDTHELMTFEKYLGEYGTD